MKERLYLGCPPANKLKRPRKYFYCFELICKSMYLFKSILCFKEIEKDCERFLVQSKKKTIVDVVNIALANLKFHAMHATTEYICNICVMVSSRREIICSRTWKNYRNLWEPESWPCFPAEKFG